MVPANHQATEYLSITHSHVPSFWRRATSEVTVPSRLRVEVRARSPQMSAGRVVRFGRFWVLQTTSEVFTRISPDNSLERLTECGVGLIPDQSSDFWELLVTPFK